MVPDLVLLTYKKVKKKWKECVVFVENNAIFWLHLANCNLPHSQLSCGNNLHNFCKNLKLFSVQDLFLEMCISVSPIFCWRLYNLSACRNISVLLSIQWPFHGHLTLFKSESNIFHFLWIFLLLQYFMEHS